MPRQTIYLGDSVYYICDHGCYYLFLNNGERGEDRELVQKNLIILEPEILTALIRFINQTSTPTL